MTDTTGMVPDKPLLDLIILDCPDALELATFYSAVLGWALEDGSDKDWANLVPPGGGLSPDNPDGRATLSFQRIDDFVRPTWPGGAHPQQFHLDLWAGDIDHPSRRCSRPARRCTSTSRRRTAASGSTPTRPATPSASSASPRPDAIAATRGGKAPMMRIGYFLSCEELDPATLVEQARLAEEAGFEALWISDHFHPWNDEQGQSPFVWGVIGAISQVCSLPVTTAVTCPTVRIHPAVVAQAAATAPSSSKGRFTLGVGTGEALNEHVLGDRWPTEDVRLEMLEEAVDVMRELWAGDFVYHHGRHYTVENARIYTRPDEPLPVYVSAFGREVLRHRAADRRRLHHHPAGRRARARSGRPRPAPTSRPRRATRSASRRRRTRASGSRTGSGATAACPASCPRCCRRRSTSSRPASSSRRT